MDVLPLPQPRMADQTAQMRQAAVDLEAAFLTEMLKHAGLGATRDTFGGGAGEEQFSSMMVREQAQQIANTGGIGLAESLFRAMEARQNGQ